MDFDDSDLTPPPMMFDAARESEPRAKAWADREVDYVTEIAQLKQQIIDLRNRNARLVLEVRSLRRLAPPPQ